MPPSAVALSQQLSTLPQEAVLEDLLQADVASFVGGPEEGPEEGLPGPGAEPPATAGESASYWGAENAFTRSPTV